MLSSQYLALDSHGECMFPEIDLRKQNDASWQIRDHA